MSVGEYSPLFMQRVQILFLFLQVGSGCISLNLYVSNLFLLNLIPYFWRAIKISEYGEPI